MNVLLSAYACCPGKGSEPQIGWNWARELSARHPTWIITRRLHQRAIEEYLQDRPIPNAHFVYVDLPRWARAWKDLPSGVYLYYLLWQALAYFRARRLCSEVNFDVAQHVTFCMFWMPSFASFLSLPFIWGPVGGGETMPAGFRAALPLQQRIFEHLRDLARQLALWNPLVRIAARRSVLALAGTPETAGYLRRLGCRKVQVMPLVGVNDEDLAQFVTAGERGNGFRVFSAGRLLGWKGFHLVLQAMAELRGKLEGLEYWILGNGPERPRLEQMVRDLQLQEHVHFVDSIKRVELLRRMGTFHVLAHPSLHDSGGFVCMEAMASGCPVICLDMGGPAVQVDHTCGFSIPAANPGEAVTGIANALQQLRERPELLHRLADGGRAQVVERLSFARYMDSLAAYYGVAAISAEIPQNADAIGVYP